MLTKSQVDKAGRTIRKWMMDPNSSPLMQQRELQAVQVLNEFRAAHSQPLLKANNGLRSMLRSEGCSVEVSQRLKRMVTIMDKLIRHPTMALSTMQDIGGCRAILANIGEVRRVQKRIARRRPPVKIDDYVSQPRASGYSAVHVVVLYDDRYIEVQLRTRLMHEWAIAVERLGGRIDMDLKSSEGPSEVLSWLEAVAEAMSIEDQGGLVDAALAERITLLREAASPHLVRGGQR